MQEVGMSAVLLPVGSGGASTSTGQIVAITTKGIGSAPAAQGTSLLARGGTSTSAGQAMSLPPRGGSAFQVASNTPRAVASTSGFQEAVTAPRNRFYVELKEGETNVVSWKKLLKDAQRNASSVFSEAPAGANPALEARFVPERAVLAQASMEAVQEPLPPPPNRFSSVIEKIERLYKGVDSDEEDAGASLDDSQYDSKDGFIDDTELDEYFSVDKAKTKHTGFFVNRGKLEKINELPPPPPVPVPRKRKRKDANIVSGETVTEEFAKKRVNTGLRLKDAARKTPVPCTTAGVEANPTLHRSSEEPLISKSTKRVKPVLDDRESYVEPVSVLLNDRGAEENIDNNFKVEEVKKDLDKKMQTTVVELSDDDTDSLEVLKPELDAKERGNSDNAVTKKQVKTHTERNESSDDETNPANKSAKAFVEEEPVKDVQKESKTPEIVSKVKKSQQVIKDEDSRETDGIGKTPSAILTSSPGAKEASPKKCAGWPKGTVLERAIHDLERGVAEAFPLTGDRQAAIERAEAGGKSKRLPREVKQKLAKVARLSAKKGKITDDLIDRLMNIIGHVMRLKTLKRNLKSMVEMGLNAKQEKDVRLQDMKREVTELVKSRVSSFLALDAGQREGSSGQAATGSTGRAGGRFKWDQVTEDRICDLYDHYVEGMDEHKGPQIRKLYIELAELWPDGWMDNHGIKGAIIRAKDRRKKQNKIKMGEEKRMRKAALATDRQKLERESLLMEKRHLNMTSSSLVQPAAKTVIPGKEKLTIKSTKHRVDETSKHLDERSKRTDKGQMKHVEEARRIAIEAASRQHVEPTSEKLGADTSATRENGISAPNLVKVKSILKTDELVKVKRSEDGTKVKRKIPRKSFEGKIVEHVLKKKSRNESVDKDNLETLRTSNILNSPLLKIKKKKPKISSDGKVYSSSKISPQTAVQSKADRLVNGGHPSQSMHNVPRVSEPERVRDVARWPTEAARLLND